MRITSLAPVDTDGRLVSHVLADIREALKGMGVESDEGDWSPTYTRESVWPAARWIAAYVVRGSNEGWYAHLDAVLEGIGGMDGEYGKPNVMLAMAKFWNRDLAFEYCKLTMQLLEGREG